MTRSAEHAFPLYAVYARGFTFDSIKVLESEDPFRVTQAIRSLQRLNRFVEVTRNGDAGMFCQRCGEWGFYNGNDLCEIQHGLIVHYQTCWEAGDELA